METNYELTIGHLKRTLPIIPISDTIAIASFVLLGDAELAHYAAQELAKRIDVPFDYLVTIESKGIPLAQEMSRITDHEKYFVLRKSVKAYMENPIAIGVRSITTAHGQKLVLDGNDAKQLKDKRVVIVDDVISTGGSIASAEQLLSKVGANVVGKCAILAEGDAAQRIDCVYLEHLPLFDISDPKSVAKS